MNVTYLGPAGATFSAIAYDRLAELYGAPLATDPETKLHFAKANEDVLPLMLENGGYGAIAMETRAEGRVDPPINSFIELLKKYDNNCPIKVIGAFEMKISFVLMARPGMAFEDIATVIAHPKALGACRNNLKRFKMETIEVPSNGKAAEDVSLSGWQMKMAALGPIQAAHKYGLEVLAEAFEDKEAITTFFLLGPESHRASIYIPQRALTVFRIPHMPGALVKVLIPFADSGVNMRKIHSLDGENDVVDFAVITEFGSGGDIHETALKNAEKNMEKWIQFGPFPVLSE